MKRWCVIAAVLLGSLTTFAPAAGAAAQLGCNASSSEITSTVTAGGGLQVSASAGHFATCTAVPSSGTDGTWHQSPICELGGAAICTEPALCDDESPMTYVWFETADGTDLPGSNFCASDGEEPVEITAGMVLNALRHIPLPPSDLIVQPPNGRTLVNFDTNFYTEATPLDRTLRLLGQRVDLRIWPSSYEWHFGDGEAIATESAGAPYPDLEITHSYTTKGQVGPAVDTTYAAEFRVNAGPWRPVPGTVTISGDTVALEVVEATPTLVGYR
jgi:hypothetical protein